MARVKRNTKHVIAADAIAEKPHFGVTQRDIAIRCGVSQVAVSLALRNDPSIGKAMTENVHRIAAELGYNPAANDSARRLIARRHGTRLLNKVIALFMPQHYTSASYFVHLFQGVQDVLEEKGYGLLVITPSSSSEWTTLPEIIQRTGIDGVIDIGYDFAAKRLKPNAPSEWAALPVVVFLRPQTGCSVVRFDYETATYTATSHLLAQGHRDIVQYLSFLPDELETLRIAGARRAYREFGVDPDTHLHHLRISYHWLTADRSRARDEYAAHPEEAAYQQALLTLLHTHAEISAILAWNDAVAIELWYTLIQTGLRVPDDISIVGLDDTAPILNDLGHNILTTVHVPLYELGNAAAAILLRQIDAVPAGMHEESVTLGGELIVRATTAPQSR